MKKLLLITIIPFLGFSQSFYSEQLLECMLVQDNAVQIDYVEFKYGESSELFETLDLIIFGYSEQYIEKSLGVEEYSVLDYGGVFVPPNKKQVKRLKAILKAVKKNKDIVIRENLNFCRLGYENGTFIVNFFDRTESPDIPFEIEENIGSSKILSSSELVLSIDEMKDFIRLVY